MSANKLLQAASGGAGESVYVEDVFSTYLYTGNGSTQTITNGIDLSGEGGLVWIKDRSSASNQHSLNDTERGATKLLKSNSTDAEGTSDLTAFNSNGFDVRYQQTGYINESGGNLVSWSFRKQAGFFDVVTWTGDGSSTRTLSHNLDANIGAVLIKGLNESEGWVVAHRSTSAGNKVLQLNTTSAETTANHTFISGSTLTVGTAGNPSFSTNDSGINYVAYLFAHVPTTDYIEENFSAEYFADGSSPVSVNGPDGSGEYNFYTNSLNNNTYAKIAGTGYSTSGYENWDGISDVVYAATGNRYRVGTYQYTNGGVAPHYAVRYYAGYSGSTVDDDESYMVCGTFEGNTKVTIGWEPQWILTKRADSSENWNIFDTMRGMTLSTSAPALYPNLSNAENASDLIVLHADGFTPYQSTGTATYIYVAIRRPMKTPESGSDVFSVYGYSDTGLTSGGITASNRTMINGGSNGGSGFPVDTFMHKTRTTATYGLHVFDRLRGKGKSLLTDETASSPAGDGATNSGFDFQEGVDVEYNGEMYYYTSGAGNRTHVTYHWKRAPNFFDTVLYTGDGSGTRTVKHNLKQAPKFMFVKRHNGSRNWYAYFEPLGNTKYLLGAGLGGTGQNPAATDNGTRWASTTPTSSVFTVGSSEDVNGNNMQYVAYLWGDVDGVSKVGSYSSDGSNDITVTTGFTPSFVLIKCSSHTSTNWIYFDDHRGLGAGTKLYWNDDAAQQSDSDYVITTTATTMTIKRGGDEINSYSSGRDYVFLAVA